MGAEQFLAHHVSRHGGDLFVLRLDGSDLRRLFKLDLALGKGRDSGERLPDDVQTERQIRFHHLHARR